MNRKNKHLLAAVMTCGLATWSATLAQPVITAQPQNQTNVAGTTAMFTVSATGTNLLSYQWRSHLLNTISFTNIPFGTEATLVLTNVQPTSRRFGVVVTDAGGLSVTSSPLVTLTVVTPPSITPANPTASLFADVTLFAANGSAAPLTYQWLFNGAPIPGAVTNRLVVTNVQKTNAGTYALVATYAFGSATSQLARLTITLFSSLYCFGHSWTDTHNSSWPAQQYYMNRGCNGPMWPEYLSTNFGFAYDPARNFAVGGASSGDVLNLQIPQLSNPADARLALFVVWPFEGDFAQAEFTNPNLDQSVTNDAYWNGVIRTMVQNTTNSIIALYAKGARSILVPSMAAYGSTPGIGTSSESTRSKLNEWSASANVALAAALDNLESVKPDLRILRLDFFAKFNQLLANFSDYGFTKVLPPALLDLALLDKSFTGPGTNYVWWDGRHGTTKTHRIWTSWIYDLVTHASLERLSLTVNGNTASLRLSKLNIGRDYTLQASSDLKNWNDVQTFTASAGTNQVPQPLSARESSVFFRLQWQQ